MPSRLIVMTLLVALSACSINKVTNETPFIKSGLEPVTSSTGTLHHRVLLLGDAGHSSIEPLQASLQKAAERASLEPERTSVVMLGDNIYYVGFPNKDEDQSEFSDAQLKSISYLQAQLNIAKLSAAEMFLVPGNHDWYATQVDSQAEYIANFGRDNQLQTRFTPYQAGAEPLPEVVHREGISVVFLDSMWMIKADEQQLQNALQHLDRLLEQTSQSHPENIVLVTAHHPIETMGPHNRYYTSIGYKVFISLISLFMENDQDTDHPRYDRFIKGVEASLAPYPKVVYAAGHDHSLQVFKNQTGQAPHYRLVSGAANTSKLTGVGSNDNTDFALSQEGFMELDITDRGAVLRVYDIHHQQPVHQQWLWLNAPVH